MALKMIRGRAVAGVAPLCLVVALFLIVGCTSSLSEKSELLTLSHTREEIVDFADQETATIYDPLSLLKRGEAYWVKGDYIEAASEYRRFLELFPSHKMAAFAQYSLAESYARQISATDRDSTPIDNALVAFNKVLTKYPDSLYAKEASEKTKGLIRQKAESQFNIAYFYYRNEAYPAAIARFKNILEQGPAGDVTEKTLYYMGISHYRNGDKETAQRVFQRLKSEYAASPYLQKMPF